MNGDPVREPVSRVGSARDRILTRIRDANEGRVRVSHPGALPVELEPPVAFGSSARTDPVDAFEARFTAAGGEVVRLGGEGAAREWLAEFSRAFASAASGTDVPAALRPFLADAPPAAADLGVNMAVGAAAQTGSLVLASSGGRGPQLLPPVALVWVRAEDIRPTLGEALTDRLTRAAGRLPATLALHSGPSKSADIGQILVRGVHGPGRIIAAILGSRIVESGPRA